MADEALESGAQTQPQGGPRQRPTKMALAAAQSFLAGIGGRLKRRWASLPPRPFTSRLSRRRVPLLVKFLSAIAAGALLGLFAMQLALDRSVGLTGVKAGPWIGWPKNGAMNIDPYARAALARSGELPLGSAEGLSLVAETDSSDRPLTSACDYRLSGPMPRAAYWTLTLLSPSGRLVANPAQRHGFVSSEILRSADGGFEIAISRRARAGNWLPAGEGPFVLLLRLYDAELSASATEFEADDLPALIRGDCR